MLRRLEGMEHNAMTEKEEPNNSVHCINPMLSSKITLVAANKVHPYLGQTWKPARQDLLTIVGEYGESTIKLFRPLHEAGVPKDALQAIALLSVPRLDDEERDDCVDCLSVFFASRNYSYHIKLGCIRILVLLTSPIKASWQLEEGCLKETLSFIHDRTQDWVLPEHSEALLLLQLRAKCLWCMEISHQEYCSTVDSVIKGSVIAAESIADAAKWVERGLKRSVPVMHIGLEAAGDQLKGMMTPTTATGRCENVQAVASYASVAKTATAGVREKVKFAADGVRDASVKGIHMAAKKFEDERIGHMLVRDKNHREVFMAAGRVGMATLGAAAVVGEAVFETSTSVSRKTVAVTADVVRHKYGDDAGQILQDGCDTTGNILTTIAHVALLESRVWSKSVAKNAGKVQFRNQYDDGGEEELPEDPLLYLDSTKAEAIAVVRRLHRTTNMLGKDVASITRI